LKVLREFSRLVDSLESIQASIERVIEQRRAGGDTIERLENLELSRHQFEAEVEGILLKADGKLQAANNSEARTRTMKKSYERFTDPLDPEHDEVEEAIQAGYVPRSQEQEVQPMPMDLEQQRKTLALMAKFS